MTNPLKQLEEFGQSPWLDNVNRADLKKGVLDKMIAEDGLKGVTSNPAIFEKAMGGPDVYDEQLKQLLGAGDKSAGDLYEGMAIEDIREVADKLKPVWDKTGRRRWLCEPGSLALPRQQHRSDAQRGATPVEDRRPP